jgi:GPH family glycoside/pentoside/hexuronide:cation symporter
MKILGIALGGVLLTTMWGLRGMVQLYAEKALNLPITLIFIVVSLYSIWDAVNDPYTGYLLDKSKKFTSKRGKRFPYIIIGVIGAIFSLILLYLPISFDPIVAMFWLLLLLIIWDQFQTLFELGATGLTVDMFRDKEQRVKYGAFSAILRAIGSIIRGLVLPVTLAMFGGESSPWAYLITAVILCVFLLIITIPYGVSIREPEEMIKFRTRLDEEGKSTSPFKEIMVQVLKNKNFTSLILAVCAFSVYTGCLTTGIYYYVVDGLGFNVGMVAIFNVLFLLVQFTTVPLWMKIVKKIGAKKSYFYSLLIFVIGAPLFALFGWSFIPALVIGMLGGVGNAGQAVTIMVAISENIDDATVKSGKREESSYMGVLRFFSATAILWQVLIFMLVAMVTGYDGTIEYDFSAGIIPSIPARLGLNFQISIIPGTIVLIASLIYLKYNTITKEVAIENKKKLLEMDL